MTALAVPSYRTQRRRHDGLLRTILRLTAVELRLLLREPGVLVGLVAFPAVTVLVLAGVFGSDPDPDFGGVIPSEHYVVGYVGVVLASLGLVTLPVAPRRPPRARRAAPLPRRRPRRPGGRRQPHRPRGASSARSPSAVVLLVGGVVYGVPAPEDPVAASSPGSSPACCASSPSAAPSAP